MLRAYVSSTYKDLRTHRTRVAEVLRRLNLLDVAMEHYGADERQPTERCIGDVSNCDIYICLVAWRYGYVPEEDNPDHRSITELEYEAAVRQGVDALVFLADEQAPWSPALIDHDRTLVEAFRERLSAERSPDRFTSEDDLAARVTQAVMDWRQRHDAPTPHTKGLALDGYASALRRRYGTLDLDVLTPPESGEEPPVQLRSVYVELNLREGVPSVELPIAVRQRLAALDEPAPAHRPQWPPAPNERAVGPALSFLAASSSRHVVLGQPGSGKSTLVRRVALGLIDREAETTDALGDIVPFIVELRHYAPAYRDGSVRSLFGFLSRLAEAEGWGLTEDDFDAALADGALALFDGLDEVFDSALRADVARQIVAFADRHPAARVVVTSRVVGYASKAFAAADFKHSSIDDLDRGQVDAFLTRWYAGSASPPERADELKRRLLAAYHDVPSIRQLAGSPLLLTLLALINRHRELPRERARLYEHAAEVLIHHWDVSKDLGKSEPDVYLDEEDKKSILRRLAFEMQCGVEGMAGNYVHRDELEATFVGYLRERLGLDQLAALRLAKQLVEQFRFRNYVLVLYGAELYGFVHRALLEYFAALAVKTRFERTREIDFEHLEEMVIDRALDPTWREVLLLLLSMLDATVATRLIDSLLASSPAESSYNEPRCLALALAALADARERGAFARSAEQALRLVGDYLERTLAESPWVLWFSYRGDDSFFQSAATIARRWPRPDLANEWLRRNLTSEWPPPDVPQFGWANETAPAATGSFLNGLSGGLAAVVAGDKEHFGEIVDLGFRFRQYIAHAQPAHRAIGAWGWAFHPMTLIEPTSAQPIVDLVEKDPVSAVRWHAVFALMAMGLFGRASFADIFLRVSRTDASANVRAAALVAYSTSDVPASERASVVSGFIADPESEVRLAAVNSIVSLPYVPDELESQALSILQNDPDVTLRWRAAVLFGNQLAGRPSAFATLSKSLHDDPHKRVRSEALTVLTEAFAEHPEYPGLILDALRTDRSDEVRSKALRIVLEDPDTFADADDLLFDRARYDPSSAVRALALRALYGRRPETDVNTRALALHTLTNDSNGDNRLEAARELIEREPSRKRLRRLLALRAEEDRSARVRQALQRLKESIE